MRMLAISILTALALAGCSPPPSAPAQDSPATTPAPEQNAPPPASETQPAPTEPAPSPQTDEPAPPPPEAAPTAPDDRGGQDMNRDATSGRGAQGRVEFPTREIQAERPSIALPRGGTRLPPVAAPPPPLPPSPPGGATTRSLRVTATPVIVEIARTDERRAANGGSSVVLFSEGAGNAYRNTVTCVNIWNLMDTATTQEVHVGIRKASDGTIEALRPLYWLNRTATPPAQRSCAERIANYDFTRAKTIRDKYGLNRAGPYFVVARSDEQAAAVIDLTGKTDREIADLVRYFRDGFAFQNDIWDPSRADPTKKRSLLVSFFGPRFRESLVASLGFVAPAARAGCQLGDLRDTPCS